MENMDHSTKMGDDKLAENTSNAPKFIWDFDEKRLHRLSVVRDTIDALQCNCVCPKKKSIEQAK